MTTYTFWLFCSSQQCCQDDIQVSKDWLFQVVSTYFWNSIWKCVKCGLWCWYNVLFWMSTWILTRSCTSLSSLAIAANSALFGSCGPKTTRPLRPLPPAFLTRLPGLLSPPPRLPLPLHLPLARPRAWGIPGLDGVSWPLGLADRDLLELSEIWKVYIKIWWL